MADSLYAGDQTNLGGMFQGIMKALYHQQAVADKKQEGIEKRISAQNKDVNSLIEKINPDGLRPRDMEGFSQRMNQVKELNHKMQTSTNDNDRMKYAAEIRGQFNGIRMYVSNSKKWGKRTEEMNLDMIKNPWNYTEGAKSHLEGLMDTPSGELSDAKFNSGTFRRNVDGSKIKKNIESMADGLLKVSDWGEVQKTRSTVGNNRGTETLQTKEVPEELFTTRLLQEYQGSEEFKAYISQTYPDISPQEAITDIARTAVAEGRLKSTSERKFVKDRVPRAVKTSTKEGVLGANNENLHYDQEIPFGQTSFRTDRFVPIKAENVEYTQGEFINLATGKTVTGGGKVDLSSVLDAPVDKLTGQVVDENFAQNNPDKIEYRQFARGTMTTTRNDLLQGTIKVETPVLITKENVARNLPNTNKTNEILSGFDKAERKKGSAPKPPTAEDLINKYNPK